MRCSSFGVKCLLGLLLGIALAIPGMSVLASGDHSTQGSHVTKGSKAAGLKNCVAPTSEIRRYHMLYLKHDRDEVVRHGNRRVKYSISACIDCHASKNDQGEYLPVTDEGQFCEACHEHVAVEPPCFDCHRTTPDLKARRREGMTQEDHSQVLDSNAYRIVSEPFVHPSSPLN